MAERLSFDKTVTMGLVLTILIQSAGAFLWAGSAEARISELERGAENTVSVAERLARLEEQSRANHQTLLRIEARMEERRD